MSAVADKRFPDCLFPLSRPRLNQPGAPCGFLLVMLFISIPAPQVVSPAYACFNDPREHRHTKPGEPIYRSQRRLQTALSPPEIDAENWQRVAETLKGEISFDGLHEYGLALAYSGQYEQARQVWEDLEAKHPGKYSVASALGTTYELLGDNQKALHWIKEGIRRNEQSHEKSEWLHVKILEAKIAAEKDPDWFKNNSVLGISFGDQPLPQSLPSYGFGNSGAALDKFQLADALVYQLSERLRFIREPDPVVADLLFQLGNTLLLLDAHFSADVALTKAEHFGFEGKLLEARQRLARREMIAQRDAAFFFGLLKVLIALGLIVAAIVGTIRFLRKRSKRKRSLAAESMIS